MEPSQLNPLLHSGNLGLLEGSFFGSFRGSGVVPTLSLEIYTVPTLSTWVSTVHLEVSNLPNDSPVEPLSS